MPRTAFGGHSVQVRKGDKRNERLLDLYAGKTLDAKELAIYWDKIRATVLGHEVKVLAAYGPHEDSFSKPSALFIRSAD
jgi:hypothetical protein